ncbi:lipopolysaccharide biosynthesis protein [Polymorphobacter multimanifer]|uniref:oligosaccharide flippase family protein n=1 Tax=Polymorphobacter multimanifer TaxID=1070431 RepID=UPI00166CC612|nr:oligosaccharide flippase family protein [Polymorphobacter multimanifer]GGI75405.1 lipopolysaccharide biosynthesis protein [Polymorphobacter multimanifer]
MTEIPRDAGRAGTAIPRGKAKSASGLVLRSGASMVAARLVRTLLTVAGMVVLARLLTPAEFGVVALTTTLTVLSLVIVEGAIDLPSLRHTEMTRDAMRSMIWTTLLFMMPLAAAIFAVAPMIERALGIPQLATALRAVLPVMLLQTFFVAGSSVLRLQHRFNTVAIVSIASVAVYLVAAVVLALLDVGLWSIIIAQNVSVLFTVVLLARLTSIDLRWPKRLSLAAVGQVGAYGVSSRVLAWFWSSIDTIAVGAALGPAAVGIYTRAYNITIQFKEPFVALDAPTRQGLIAVRKRDGNVVAQAVVMLRLLTIATASAAAICVVLREPIILILLGDQWQAAAPVLAILILGLPARIALNFFDALAATTGSMPNMMLRHAILCVVMGGGVYLAAPHGIAAVAGVVCAALYLALLLPARAKERTLTGGRLALLGAMAPGLGLGAALLALGEYALVPLADGGLLATLAYTLPAYGLLALAIAAFLPDRWLPIQLRTARAALWHRTADRFQSIKKTEERG